MRSSTRRAIPARRCAAPRAARAVAAVVLLCAASCAAAQEELHVRGELRLGLAYFDYVETYQGRTLDREKGVLPAVALESEVRWRWAFARLAFRLAGGSVSYAGELQTTDSALNGIWATGQSDALQLDGRLEAGGLVDPGRRLALFAGLGLRRWQRSLPTCVRSNGVTYQLRGYTETYGWGELDAGARYAIVLTPRDAWDVEAGLLRTLAPRLEVDYLGSPVSLALGPRFGWRAGTTYRRSFAPAWFVVVGLWGEGYAFGESAVDPVHGILEPDSRTLRFGLELGVGGRF